MTQVRPTTERRAFGRRSSNDHAVARIPGRPPVRCTIKNLSPVGALLDFGTETYLPFNFKLTWEVGGREEDCELRHRNGAFVGVFFNRNQEVVPEQKPSLTVDDVRSWMAPSPGGRR